MPLNVLAGGGGDLGPLTAASEAADLAAARAALEIVVGHPGLKKDGSTLYSTWEVGGISTVALVANQLYTGLCYTPEPMVIERIGIGVTTLGAGNARLGVYSNVNGVPTARLLDAGTVDLSSTGDKFITGLTLEVRPGFFFLSLVADVIATVRSLSFARQNVLGHTATSQSSTTLYDTTFAYAVLPSTHPTPTASNASSMPAIFWRPAV